MSQVRETIYISTKSSCMETPGNPRDPNGIKYSSLAKSILAKLTIRMGEQLLPLPIQFRIHLVRKHSFPASNSTSGGLLARQRFCGKPWKVRSLASKYWVRYPAIWKSLLNHTCPFKLYTVLVSFDTTQLIRPNLFYCFNLRRDGVVVPYGKSLDTGVVNPRGYTLQYNGKYNFFLGN